MIKNPGGEVALWSVLWILAGLFLSYMSLQAGKTGLCVMYAILAVASVLLWLDIRQAKWLIIVYFAFATFGGIVALSTIGLDLRLAGQMFAAIYSIVLLWRWDGGPNAD